MNLTCLNTECPENLNGTHCSNARVAACFNRVRPEKSKVATSGYLEARELIWLEVYCWLCGEKNEMAFVAPRRLYSGLYESACPSCGHKSYLTKEDLVEVRDRRTNRGIPQ